MMIPSFLCIMFLLLPATCLAGPIEATVLSVSPSVASHLGGKSTSLEVKQKVPVASTIISDAQGRAQLMFPDTTTISIAPNTELALTEFADSPKEESIILNMAIGTARFITGEISRRKPSAMIVNTPQVDVSIRGTMVTIMVSGDTSKVYLTETSGLGVTVTDRRTGETRKISRPGTMIIVGPKGMQERQGELSEVRKMRDSLRPAPETSDGNHTQITGMDHARIGTSPAGLDTALNPGLAGLSDQILASQHPESTGLDLSLINGTYAGGTSLSSIEFDVDGNANISNASFGMNLSYGNGGSGTLGPGGNFSINNFPNLSNDVDSATLNGQFADPSGGTYNLQVNVNQAGSTSPVPNNDAGQFGKAP